MSVEWRDNHSLVDCTSLSGYIDGIITPSGELTLMRVLVNIERPCYARDNTLR